MNRVIYPGSFDPITRGHMNIIEQVSKLFDEVIVLVLNNSSKNNFYFSLDERVEIIKQLYINNSNITVVGGSGALVDLAILYDCNAIIRGLRGLSDYDYEVQLAQVNKDVSGGKVNTICLFADKDYQFISSTIVKEVFNLRKDVSNYVDPYVQKKMVLKRGDFYG